MDKPALPNWSEYRRMRRQFYLGFAIVGVGILAAEAGNMIHPALAAASTVLTLIFTMPMLYTSQKFLRAFRCPRCGNKFSGECYDSLDLSECRYCLLPRYADEHQHAK